MKFKILIFLTSILTWSNSFGQTNLIDSIEHQNLQRKFMIHLPPNFNNSSKRPLVINLHGGSGNMVNAQGFSLFNPVADNNNFVILWPQGYGIASPGFSWADGRNTSADQEGIDDVGFILKLTDTIINRFNIDTNRIYICGFSNGGFMVQRIACENPKTFAAMATLGCSMDTNLYKNCNPSKSIPFAFFNGTSDPAMPYFGGSMQNPQVTPVIPVDSMVNFWVKENKCITKIPKINVPDTFINDNSTVELYEFNDCDCNSKIKFYKIINGGHTWPGVYIPSQESVLGVTNRDINASNEIWNFFKTFSLCSQNLNSNYGNLGFEIYPNPTNNIIRIKTNSENSYKIYITNIFGNIIIENPNDKIVDLSNVSSGIYFITIIENNNILIKKIIKN